MSDIADDPMNGYLLLSSPLGQALSQGSPGDELSFRAGERERVGSVCVAGDGIGSGCLMTLGRQFCGYLESAKPFACQSTQLCPTPGRCSQTPISSSQFNVICPVQSLPQKQFPSRSPQISTKIRAVSSLTRGVSRSSRTRDGMRWTRQRRAREVCSQGGSSVSESTARKTNGADAYGKTVWSWHPLLVPSLAETRRAQPGLDQIVNPQTTVTRRIRRRGEHGISRKAIAQGK